MNYIFPIFAIFTSIWVLVGLINYVEKFVRMVYLDYLDARLHQSVFIEDFDDAFHVLLMCSVILVIFICHGPLTVKTLESLDYFGG